MIKSTFGITKEPFNQHNFKLLGQQEQILKLIKIHSQHGGFSVIVGNPGVGKSVLKDHIQTIGNEKDTIVASFSRTMHTYLNILKQLVESFQLDCPPKHYEKELIQIAYKHVRDRKTLFTLIDEAHLMDMHTLRKLRLLFDRFPGKHNLVLFGQRDLLHYLSLNVNEDIKSRITYSQTIYPLNNIDLDAYILNELEQVRLGVNTFDNGATELIIRSSEGNLRLCRNLCYASLIDACMENKKIVSIRHVNAVLIQPHWRSHEELIKQQVK